MWIEKQGIRLIGFSCFPEATQGLELWTMAVLGAPGPAAADFKSVPRCPPL